MSIKGDMIAIGLAGVVLLAAGWYAKKKLTGAAAGAVAAVGQAWDTATAAAADATAWTGNVIDKTVSWPALTAGDALGVPRTDMTECEKAKAEGRTWDASFACPASTFLGYVFE